MMLREGRCNLVLIMRDLFFFNTIRILFDDRNTDNEDIINEVSSVYNEIANKYIFLVP